MLLIGPRQVGKTTLARTFVPAGGANYFDLENPVIAEQFRRPLSVLESLMRGWGSVVGAGIRWGGDEALRGMAVA